MLASRRAANLRCSALRSVAPVGAGGHSHARFDFVLAGKSHPNTLQATLLLARTLARLKQVASQLRPRAIQAAGLEPLLTMKSTRTVISATCAEPIAPISRASHATSYLFFLFAQGPEAKSLVKEALAAVGQDASRDTGVPDPAAAIFQGAAAVLQASAGHSLKALSHPRPHLS